MERLGSHVKTNLCMCPERIPNEGRTQNSSVGGAWILSF